MAVAMVAGFAAVVLMKSVGGGFLKCILVPAARFVDRILLEHIAPLTGIKFEEVWLRWGVYWLVFFGLAVLGALTPVALGLVAVLTALIAILAIYRQWEQDETERRLLEDAGDSIPYRNDYRNELLTGLAIMMGFFALGFSRLEELFPLYAGDPRLPVASTAMFIWGEFLKAIPLVDASEVYGWQNISGLEASGGVGRTATFTVRVIFDLVIIAALIRTVDIVRRMTGGFDLRQVERDLAKGDDALINAAISRLQELALLGRLNALRALTDIALARRADGRVSNLSHREEAATAMLELMEQRGDMAMGIIAVESLRVLSSEWDQQLSPVSWALSQNNLGRALKSLGEMAGDPARLQEAVDAHLSALEALKIDTSPEDWAKTQTMMGVALAELGKVLGDPIRLREAIHAHNNALEVHTRDVRPADWARVQSNLGVTFQALGEMMEDPAPLEDAVSSYQGALTVFTLGTSPEKWAMVQNNLGTALDALGRTLNDPTHFEKAIDAYRSALVVYTRKAGRADWAMVQANLGSAHGTLGSLTRDRFQLNAAVKACRNALEIYTPSSSPSYWAVTQYNLGVALTALGEMTGDPVRLEGAVQAFRGVLDVYTREISPAKWAMTQNALGSALAALGKMAGDLVSLEEAKALFEELAAFRTKRGETEKADAARDQISEIERLLGDLRGNT